MQAHVTRARALTLTAGVGGLLVFPRRAKAATSTIRISGFPADSYSEPYYAIDQGLLERAAINLAIVYQTNAGGVAPLVLGDTIEVGMGDPVQVANPYLAGAPLAIFGGSGLYSTNAPNTVMVVALGSTLAKPTDFEGKTIALISLASISSLATREWLRQGGADETKVHLIELPFGSIVPALQRGTVDGALLSEPFLSLNRDNVRTIAKPFDAIARSFYISSFFAKRSWLQTNRDLARAFLNAMYEAAKWANAHQAESATILAKYSKLDLTQVRSMTRVSFATSFDAGHVQPVLDIASKYGQLTRNVTAAEIMMPVT